MTLMTKIGAAFLTLAAALPAFGADGFLNIQPAYKPKEAVSTARVEGLALHDKFCLYGWADLDKTGDEALPGKARFGELRLDYTALDTKVASVALSSEFEGVTDGADRQKFGVTITPKLGEKNYTSIELWGHQTASSRGPQTSLFTKQHLSDKVSTSALLVYDFAKSETPASWYREFEGEYKFSDGVRAFGQVRFAGDPSAWNPTYVAGVKFCPVGEKTFF